MKAGPGGSGRGSLHAGRLWLGLAALAWPAGGAEDVIHLKDGSAIRCEIVAITDNVLTYKTTLDLGGGRTASAQPTISPDLVDYIEFAPAPGEAALMAEPEAAPLEELRALWDDRARHLHRPRSRAGEIGLAYAARLLGEGEAFRWNAALAVYDRLIERDWSEAGRNEARKGRLRGLIQLGRLEEAVGEARRLAEETEDLEMLAEARHAMARADFEALKALEEEHPKWDEDEEVRPERERLYHAAVDQFLWPSLFHGAAEELAARGLLAAAEIHRFAGAEEEARACLGDILALYPAAAAAPAARAALEASPDPENQP